MTLDSRLQVRKRKTQVASRLFYATAGRNLDLLEESEKLKILAKEEPKTNKIALYLFVALGALWVLWAPLFFVGAVLGVLGAFLGFSWGCLGFLWVLLGLSWRAIERKHFQSENAKLQKLSFAYFDMLP